MVFKVIISNFSVNHFTTFNSISLFFNLVGTDHIKPVTIVGIFILVFTLLIYNEIIILRFCDFDKNTTIQINRRSIIVLNCYFGEDDEEISAKANENYVIMKEDIKGSNDESGLTFWIIYFMVEKKMYKIIKIN